MKLKYKQAYMDMAIRFGQTSEAKRLKVGCLLVKKGGIISEGVNGQPPGWPTEVCEDGDNKTLPTVRHSEVAALEKLQNKTETCEGASMFISHSPCFYCAIKIHSSGIKEVYYRERYSSDAGIDYLTSKGIPVMKLDIFDKGC